MSRTQDANNTLPISIHCKKCLRGYGTLCDALGAVTPEQALDIGFDKNVSQDFMQDAQSRFKAWAVNIAALQGAQLQSSLDFRLREATEVRQRIVKILTTLNESLNEALLIINGTEPNEKWDIGAISDSDDDNASTPEETTQTSDLEQLFTAIKTANSSLMKLSMVIRNSPSRDDYLKAASRYNFDSRYDIGHVKEKHGAAKRSSDWLLERLGKAITRRRQYLKYREEHHAKLSRDWDEAPREEVVVDPDTVAKVMAALLAKPENTIAQTKATTYVENKAINERDGIELDQGSFGSQMSYEPTVVSEAVNKLSVPPPPNMAFEGIPFEYGEPFQCPYCYMEQTVKNKTAWKQHVFRDLKPYVCTFRECNLRMFRSRNEWFAHELQNHRREWVCISCLSSFADKAKFSHHLQSMHANLVAGSQLEALVLQCEEPVDKIPTSGCLLCDEWESNLLDPKQDSKRLFLNNGEIMEPCGTRGQFRRHLGRHMEQLALFALPMAEEDEMEDDSLEGDSDDDVKDKDVDPKSNENLSNVFDDNSFPEGLRGAILKRVQELKIADFDELVRVIFEEIRHKHYPDEDTATGRYLFTFLDKNLTRDSSDGAPWEVKPEVASIYSLVPADLALGNEGYSPETKQDDEDVESRSEDFHYSFVFKWGHPASEVYVTGTFDDWSKSEKLIQTGNVFEKKVRLPSAAEKIYYKYVVDGNWITDPDSPRENDNSGNVNNVITTDLIVKHTPMTAGSNVTSTTILAHAESHNTEDLTSLSNLAISQTFDPEQIRRRSSLGEQGQQSVSISADVNADRSQNLDKGEASLLSQSEDPVHGSNTSSSSWQPSPFLPQTSAINFKLKNEKASLENPVGSNRRFSEDIESFAPIPSCPRTTFSQGHYDWLTLPHCPSFDICPSCFSSVIAPTKFSPIFVPAARRLPETEVLCDFGSSPWYRIAWLLTLKGKRQDLKLFYDLANIVDTIQPCPGKHQAVRQWLSIIDPKTRAPINGFDVCNSCAKHIETLLPALQDIFVAVDSHGSSSRICSLRFDSKRFIRYFDAFETTADRADDDGIAPDLQDIATLARRLASIPECQLDKELIDRKWYLITQLPEFTVCEECFDEVVRPQLDDRKAIPLMFHKKSQGIPKASCQLYSTNMRGIFRLAADSNDYKLLAAKAKERKTIESAYHANLAELRSNEGPMIHNEIKRIKEEWKKWE